MRGIGRDPVLAYGVFENGVKRGEDFPRGRYGDTNGADRIAKVANTLCRYLDCYGEVPLDAIDALAPSQLNEFYDRMADGDTRRIALARAMNSAPCAK